MIWEKTETYENLGTFFFKKERKKEIKKVH